MKILYGILFFIFFSGLQCFSQNIDTNTLQIDKLPAEGIFLNSRWRFHAGDNPLWISLNLNDEDWTAININQRLARFLQISKGNICWLRLTFALDASLKDSMLALSINQYGASEVYIDGKLVQRLGKVGISKDRINFNPHNQPIPFYLSKQSAHVIAIRFACAIPSSNRVLQQANVVPLSVRLQTLPSAMAEIKYSSNQSRIATGVGFVYAIFGLLFLLLFLFYRRQRLNLFYGLCNLGVVLLLITNTYIAEGQYSLNELVSLQIITEFIGRFIGMNVFLFMLLALFNRIKRWQWWYVTYILTIDFILFTFFKAQYEFINNCVHFSFIPICSWLFIYALRTGKRENRLIGILAFLVVLINISGMLSVNTGINLVPYMDIIFPLVAFPSMAIYLALKYARTHTSLEQQLIQVKNLSEENIRQEQEKQEILAAQNETLEKQVKQRTVQITAQKETLQNTLEELKETQAQLVQREKMASLGELTAGIAHEIQNPLNFVNNFSDVNAELLAELKDEINTGNKAEALCIANDVIENEQKINHHGKRADAIVKGMLQHSRASSGKKEPTDINALADEYLRLSYHGLRAKDKDFNANFTTDFDESIGKIEVVPQDIGRVLLNLYNNAFYSVNEKKKKLNGTFEPTVSVSTKRQKAKIEIIVKDNGNGIAQKHLDKIFQPFFTTKPTGEGTGLGLSLAYDIITKEHNGTIKVESEEGEGSRFIINITTT